VWRHAIYFFVLVDSEILLAASVVEEGQLDSVAADGRCLPVAALLAESIKPEAVSVTDCKIVFPSF
jgi:hypothetical protein